MFIGESGAQTAVPINPLDPVTSIVSRFNILPSGPRILATFDHQLCRTARRFDFDQVGGIYLHSMSFHTETKNANEPMRQSSHAAELDCIASGLKNPTFPKIFAVELCADCDLNCSMCHHDQMKRPKGNLPMLLWQKCAHEIAQVARVPTSGSPFAASPF